MASRIVLFATVFFSAVPAACHYSEAKEPDPVSYRSDDGATANKDRAKSTSKSGGDAESTAEPISAVADSCDDRTCVGAEDCCKGYACGFDPERSHVQRYCQAQ